MSEPDPDPRSGPVAAIRWVLHTEMTTVVFLREAAASAFVVVVIGLVLFQVSGVWPPLVAVESGSMQPDLGRGDLVFIMDEDRLVPAEATAETGIVTYRNGRDTGYRSFGGYGNVIVFNPPDRSGAPVIHRARFWVEEGERWVEDADPAFVNDRSCEAIVTCPAPHAGFITKGDANPYYDQVQGIATVVRPAWIRGTAEFSVPWLGYVRLTVGEVQSGLLTQTSEVSAAPPTRLPTDVAHRSAG